jgi:glycerol-3-phosphate dehydrogenase
MTTIIRKPASAAKINYDLIIIGGGIYGVLTAYEASKRGLKSLLLERSDFGAETTFNCLRTLHGGFRYLQKMDLYRFYESVAERSWFLQNFPDLVSPLSCLMPLYGKGVRRPSILRIASLMNDVLSYKRNNGVRQDKHLPSGKVISPEQTKISFPLVDGMGLQGGAVWYDVCMPDSQLILMEILRASCKNGTTALNYVEANKLLHTKGSVAGVVATDKENGESHEYKAPVVVNAGGPWCRDIAARFDRDEPDLFKGSIAWNMLVNRDALSTSALAITPKKPDGHTYFLLPWKGKLLAGTVHKPWSSGPENITPSPEIIQKCIDDLNYAIPSLDITRKDILYHFQGLLPAAEEGSADIAVREVIHNHADNGGPCGFYSISGVKYTTARLVAEKTLKQIFPERKVERIFSDKTSAPLQTESNSHRIFDFNWIPASHEEKWMEDLRPIIQDESVRHLDDLIFRRTSLWDNPERALEIAPKLCELFDWDISRCNEEISRVKKKINNTL